MRSARTNNGALAPGYTYKTIKMKNILIFDVESASLYGSGFAVGAIVADNKGNILDQFALMSTDAAKRSSPWVKENVLPHLKTGIDTCKTSQELRKQFYLWYMKHKDTCKVFADVSYPVETNFLNAIVWDNLHEREWDMPFPLYDVANFVDVNIDRAAVHPSYRALRKHHPLDDAKASYYSLLTSEAWKTHGHKILEQ